MVMVFVMVAILRGVRHNLLKCSRTEQVLAIVDRVRGKFKDWFGPITDILKYHMTYFFLYLQLSESRLECFSQGGIEQWQHNGCPTMPGSTGDFLRERKPSNKPISKRNHKTQVCCCKQALKD